MTNEVETYYDEFSKKFLTDMIYGNERIQQQLDFLSRAIPKNIKGVLVIGSGSGQAVHFIADRIAPAAEVLAVDISQNNIRLATTLFPHSRVKYLKCDVTHERVNGAWQAIVLPDVYEHIPKDRRKYLHDSLNQLLTADGCLLLTIPSPGKQLALQKSGQGLQIVDEIVTLEDLCELARAVHGKVTYFSMVSVYETNDYIHCVIERNADQVKPIGISDMVPLKGWPRRSVIDRAVSAMITRTGLRSVIQTMRRKRIHRRLGSSNQA